MKKLIPFFACCFILCCCKNKIAPPVTENPDSAAIITERAVALSGIDGLWTGTFDFSPADEALLKKSDEFEEAYYKKSEKANGSDDYEGDEYITNSNDIPANLRKAYYMEPLNGYYSKKSPNKVSVIITGLNDSGQVVGKSVCAGNERLLKGTYAKTNVGFTAQLKEPGDDKNDGVFKLNFSMASNKATGTWTSLAGDVKKCNLEKKDFSYSAAAGNIEGFRQSNDQGWIDFKKNPSTDMLSTKDVENLTKPELTILRNLIYARHGYTFASSSIRSYFEATDWYIPFKKDIRTDITELEKKNADKLKSFEQYASSAYDEFGR